MIKRFKANRARKQRKRHSAYGDKFWRKIYASVVIGEFYRIFVTSDAFLTFLLLGKERIVLGQNLSS